MAGYSGTPLARKFGVKPGLRAYLVGVPDDLAPVFAEMKRLTTARAPIDYAHVFETDDARLAALLPKIAAKLDDRGMLWISWPKKASKRPTTVDESRARELGLAAGLVDIKVCAVDDVWSGLKFVRRVRDRAG